jgi:hypothetical protein
MTEGSYSLIRSIPDPIRGEVFNIGIIAWNDEEYRIALNEDAAQRSVNQSPFLAKDAWVHYEQFFRDLLCPDGEFDREALNRFIAEPKGETLRLTKPAYVRLSDGPDAFNQRLDEIVKRLVRPVHRGGGSTTPVSELRSRLLRHLRSKAVHQNHAFSDTRSGVPRTCHFYANSGANIALDALRIDVSKASDAFERVDAEATKVADVLERNDLRYVVYCRSAEDEHHHFVTDRARKVLHSFGAEVVTSAEEASQLLERELEHQPVLLRS